MRIGSLFSGAGGLDMAVEAVFGGEVIWQSEVDKAASTVLAHRFPGVPNLGDITTADFNNVEPVDVICGGFPCQDVSAAGKRAGIKQGTRSGLWSIFADVIDQLRPTWVVIENVRGLLSARAHRSLEPAERTVGDQPDGLVLRAAGAVLGDLADLGYDAQWTTLAASSVGAPHRRERVFIVAYAAEQFGSQGPRSDGREPAVVGAGVGAGGGNHARDSAAGVRFVGRGAGSQSHHAPDPPRNGWDEGRPEPARQQRGFDAAVSGAELGVALLPTPNAVDGGGGSATQSMESLEQGNRQAHLTDISRLLLLPTPTTQDGANNGGPSQFERNTLPLNAEVTLLPTPNASDGSGGGQHPDRRVGHSRQLIDYVLSLPEPALLPTPKAHDGMFGSTARTSGRPIENATHLQTIACLNPTTWGKYAPAISRWESLTRPAPAPTEPNKNGNPRLSAAFSEWLMGWPDGWVTDPDIGISRNDQLRIIGNGVCPQQATAALTWLLKVAEVAA